MFTCVLALMTTCAYVYMLWCSHVSMIVCSLVYMLWWSYASMPISFNENMSTGLYALMLICLDTFLIACSYVHMFCWSHASMFTCLDNSKLPCVHDFFDHIPNHLYAFKFICLDTLMITYTYVEILWWSHTHIHWYSHVRDPYKCAHMWFLKCILVWRHKWSCC